MEELLNKSQGDCVTTLFRQKNVSLTKIENLQKRIEINNVLISNPDLFLGEEFNIHGVLGPFSSIQREVLQGGSDFIRSSNCRLFKNNSTYSVEWNKVVQLLASQGYSSFSIALHSVLERIQKDSMSFSSVTIFAPHEVNLLNYPSNVLDRVVRFHILPQRLTYRELSSFPVRTLLKTLVLNEHLEIDGVLDFMSGVVINGIEIVKPDMFVSERFVIHGISRAFKMAEITA
jgi:hypothetical protein